MPFHFFTCSAFRRCCLARTAAGVTGALPCSRRFVLPPRWHRPLHLLWMRVAGGALVDAAFGQTRQLLVGRLFLVERLLQQLCGLACAPWPVPTRRACRRPPSRSAPRAGRRRSGRRPSSSSSKSSSMIDLPSSMMPAMPSQCLPADLLVQSSRTPVRAARLPCGLFEVRFERLPQLGIRRRFRELRQRLRQLLFGVVRVAQFVEECVVESPVSAMVDVSLKCVMPRTRRLDARRIGFSCEMPVLRDRRDELVRDRVPARAATMTPGIRLAVGERRDDPARVEQLRAGAERQDRLAVAVLVLDEFERPAVRPKRVDGLAPSGRTTASYSTDGAASRLTSTSIASPDVGCTDPSVVDTNRGHGALAVRRSATATSASPSHPSATRIATRRVRMPPSPGRANSDSAGETVTSGVTSRVTTFGIGAGISRMPRPAATALGQLRVDVHQARHHALADRRRLHARQLEAERVDDVLLLDVGLAVPEQRRLRVVIGEALGLAAHLVIACFARLRKRHESRRRPPGTGSRRRASSARTTRDRDGSPADACRRAGCCAPARSAR